MSRGAENLNELETEAWACGYCHALTRITHFYQDSEGVIRHSDFAIPIGTGMRREHGPTGLSNDAIERLNARLNEFDAVRNRAAVEVRSIPLLHSVSRGG